jgi:thymidylate synthase (FAD)
MNLIKPSFEILTILDSSILKNIERAGRVCYQSDSGVDTSESFCKKIINRGHESVLEHESISVKFIIDRGVSHELVRHRLCAISQESTRYCNYKNQVTFIIPPWVSILPGIYKNGHVANIEDALWFDSCLYAEENYHLLLQKWTSQQARTVLPNSLKTELIVTANLREWRHILKLRTSQAAHPQMREVMCPLLETLKKQIPIIFEDI